MKAKSDRYRSGEKALTPKEYEELIEVIDNIQDELLIKLAITTGIRREDICAIKINNIDLGKGELTYYETKKKRWRTIDLQPSITLLIKKHLKTIEKRDDLFSFTGRTAHRHLNNFCRIAGIPERPFHALRATCVKFCQKNGWAPEQVSELTGDLISTIQKHYATPSRMEMKELVKEKPII